MADKYSYLRSSVKIFVFRKPEITSPPAEPTGQASDRRSPIEAAFLISVTWLTFKAMNRTRII